MAIDWDKVVVESDDNGVVVSAGQVALLVGADADTVTWGNITGDITQQPDLMAMVDGFATLDSPQFTGTPRTVTPPTGNNSTRIASTAFVKTAIDAMSTDLGTMAQVDDAPSDGKNYARKNGAWNAIADYVDKDKIESSDIEHPSDIYVDANDGDDTSGTGHFTRPFKTIARALQDASELFRTTIEIQGAVYDEDVYINNINVRLHCLSDSTEPARVNRVFVTKGTLLITGDFAVRDITASEGSRVYYSTSENSEYRFHITSTGGNVLVADEGSVISIEEDIKITNNIAGTLMYAKNGSIVTAGGIEPDPLQSTRNINTLMRTEGGFTSCGGINSNITYVTLMNSTNRAGDIGTLAYANEPSPNGTVTPKYWCRTNDIEAGQSSNPQWTQLGNMALGTEPQGNIVGDTLYVRKVTIQEDTTRSYGWKQVTQLGFVEEAPEDGHAYGRKDGHWVRID